MDKAQILKLKEYLPEPLEDLVDRVLSNRGFRRYSVNTGWMFAGQLVNMAVAFFVGAFVARYLGPDRFGAINYAISFAGLFAFLLGLGVDSILSRELVRVPEKKDTLLGTGMWIKFFGGFLTIGIANVLAWVTRNDAQSRFLIFLFSLTYLFQMFSVFSFYFQSQVLAKKNFQAQIVSVIVTTSAKLIGVFFHFGVVWFTLVYLIDAIIGALVIYSLYKQVQKNIVFQFDKSVALSLLKDSWPLMLTTIATTIYLDIDQIILKYMMDIRSVGVYAVAVKLSEVWYFIPNLICGSLLPAIVNAKTTNRDLYELRLGRLFWLMLILGFAVAVPVLVLARFIVLFLYGNAYAGAILPLRLYILSSLPVFLMAAITQYLIVENLSKIYLLATVCGAIANVILNIIFIPRYGVAGSALSTLVSYSVPFLTLMFFSKTRNNFFIVIKKPFLAK